jgi:beta-lactamase class A
MVAPNKKLILIVALCTGFVGITLICTYFFRGKTITELRAECKTEYDLLNPEIACDLASEEKLQTVSSLKDQADKYIAAAKAKKSISKISIFFRDLDSKKWLGISQNEGFVPASLLKLPLVIAYFKMVDVDPTFLSQKYTYAIDPEIMQQDIAPSVKLEIGKEYTIEDIMRQMMVYSDNDAMNFLLKNIDNNFLVNIFYELGVDFSDGSGNSLSPIAYSNILRMLYNSSYLTRDSSEKILTWMSEADFNDGLVAGVPSKIKVAHKFGERLVNYTTKELHDCGIVYYPGHPYIICVMTTGQDFIQLEKTIADISRITYESVEKIYP